jgi:uncharacterized protein (DUF488 family)
MATNRITLATIGYESANLADFIATLREAGISRLIDVRELPISRRKGFAKSALSEALTLAGIEYLHLRGLGDPKEGREAARAGNIAHFRSTFSRHLRTKDAQSDLRSAVSYVAKGGACLMCYERDHTKCHRSIVAKRISSMIDANVRHLGVKHGFGRRYVQIGSQLGSVSETRA